MLALQQAASFHVGTKQSLILLAARFSCTPDVRLLLVTRHRHDPVSPYDLTGSGNRTPTNGNAIATRHGRRDELTGQEFF